MKNIESILKEIGLEIPAERAEAFRKLFQENYKTIAEVENITKARDTWKERAEKAEGILTGFGDDVDPAKVLEDLKNAKTALETAKNEHARQLAERDFDDALAKALAEIKFTSASARKAVEDEIRAEGLTVKDGTILGLKEMVEKIRERDSSAFVDEKQQELEAGKAKFTAKMSPEGGQMTKEQIMAIKDGKQRREAIAQNLNLFERKE